MTELTIDGLTPKELEAARKSLITLYELKDEYARAKRHIDSVELQMAQLYDTVNMVLNRIKEIMEATITIDTTSESKGEDDGK